MAHKKNKHHEIPSNKHSSENNLRSKNVSSLADKHSFFKKIRFYWKKTWDFIWNDDSVASWVVNIILAFVIIKFVVYPLLALAFGTSLPIVAVVSGSMEHQGSFDQWWQSPASCSHMSACTQEDWYAEHNISKEDFKDYILHNGFNKGDIILLKRADPEKVSLGDILVYDASGKPMPIIHRVVAIHNENGSLFFETKGDHNPYQINGGGLNEFAVGEDQVRGKAFARMPYVGYVKIWFAKIFSFS